MLADRSQSVLSSVFDYLWRNIWLQCWAARTGLLTHWRRFDDCRWHIFVLVRRDCPWWMQFCRTDVQQGTLPGITTGERLPAGMVADRRICSTSRSLSRCTIIRRQPLLACVDGQTRHSLDCPNLVCPTIRSWLLANLHGLGELHGRCLRGIRSQCSGCRFMLKKHVCSSLTIRGSTNVQCTRGPLGLQFTWVSFFGNGHYPLLFSPIWRKDPSQ